MNKVLALSSSRVGEGGYLEAALPLIRSFLGPAPLRLAFVPFASVERDYDAYGAMVREAVKPLGHTVETILPADAATVLESCDAVLVGGGNTFKLLHDIYAYGLFDLIRGKVQAGLPYIGWSAGANLTGLTICTTNDMPIIQPLSFQSFGFFPFQLNPHYLNQKVEGYNGETRDQRLSEFIRLNPSVPVVGLPEGTALLHNEQGFTLEGTVPGILFTDVDGNISKKELPAGTDLSFLL